MIRDSMVFYASFLDAAEQIKEPDERLLFYDKVLAYGIRGKLIDTKCATVEALFTLVKPNIDANNRKFIAGKKGGRPPITIDQLTREEFVNADEINIDLRTVPAEWRKARLDRMLGMGDDDES